MNEVRLEIYLDGNGDCTIHSDAASDVDIIKALLATMCAMLTDPPEYTYKHYGEQDG